LDGAGGECSPRDEPRISLQRKLRNGSSHDALELEADRTADQVLNWPAQSPAANTKPPIRRYTGHAEADGGPVSASVADLLAGSGRPLDTKLQEDFGKRFGRDFSQVRVHTNAMAAQSAREECAHAYTVGRNIVFAGGAFLPTTHEGRRLIAHELTHVVQQIGAAAPVLQRAPDGGVKAESETKPRDKFIGCTNDQKAKIREASGQAVGLAQRAVQALVRDFPLSYEMSALRANFGSLSSDQQSTITTRYKNIAASLATKAYKCATTGKKSREGGKVFDFCGEAYCPGREITLFPDFGKAQCPADAVVLHEAAHNAGACSDIDKGRNYPPAHAENNAYSYERFATDVWAGYRAPPELKKRESSVPMTQH